MQFGEKSPNNGKNRQSFKTTKLEKKTTVAHTSTTAFFLGRIFALGNLEISRDKSPQIEEKIAQNKEILKGFRVLSTKLGQKKTLV